MPVPIAIPESVVQGLPGYLVEYLAPLMKHLNAEPKSDFGYHLGSVQVCFQGEHCGWVVNYDDAWHYYEGELPDVFK